MLKIYSSILFFIICNFCLSQSVIWSDDFENPASWTLNTSTGLNDLDANLWVISDAEGGVAAGNCGVASNGNKTLHIGCQGTWCVGTGAIYNTGDGGLGFIYATTNKRATYNLPISTVGYSNLTLKFDWIGIGQTNIDYAKVIYSIDNGATWQDLQTISGGSTCPNGQGLWQTTAINLPAQLNGIANLKLGFNWTNNNDGAGADPSFAVNNIRIEAPSAPLAAFQISDNTICAGNCIILTNQTSGATNYSWDFGNSTGSSAQNPGSACYDSPGTYQIQLVACNATGCDTSSTSVTVLAAPDNGLLYMNGEISSLQTNALYQWLLCPSLTIIPGATSVNFTPPINGEYAVIVTLANGCSDTSQCVLVDDLSFDEQSGLMVKVYPNPTRGELTFSLPEGLHQMRIVDGLGRVHLIKSVENNETLKTDLNPGLYLLIFEGLPIQPVEILIQQD